MSTHKWIDLICVAAVILSLLITVLFMNGTVFGIEKQTSEMGYESRLFSQDSVHTIDIVMEDWEGFLSTCTNEEYTNCTVVIDGERFSNVGIRGKGNTSLSTVASMDSSRYSFKLEFDQYDSTKSYYGLDKLSLNNLIQDNTLMKDYLSYQLMGEMGVAAPLCSYVQITVNGEPWGLYLAVEAIEESFLLRNYGADYGELYKPDSMSNGGGRGNGKDFQMDQWSAEEQETATGEEEMPTMGFGGQQPQRPGTDLSGEALRQALEQQGISTDRLTDVDWDTVTMDQLPQLLSQLPGVDVQALLQAMMGSVSTEMGGRGGSDVKLQYIDDDPASYSNIFDNAKTDITEADQTRLVEALNRLSAGEDLENTVDIEAVIRYFVAHTFVCNDDSYTGSMIHNYYLYEKDGVLSMLPWDYNLAFGGFQGRDASSAVNASIHSPVSGGDSSDRPMIAWIFDSEEYTQMYDSVYEELLQLDLTGLVTRTAELIAPYVQEDPTKFCTYEEFETGVAALKHFLQLRSESVALQLSGETGTVNTGDLNLSDMGTMGTGGMDRPQNNQGDGMQMPDTMTPPQGETGEGTQMPDTMTPPQDETGEGMQMPDGMPLPQGETGEGMQMPGAMTPPQGETGEGMQMPGGMTPPQGETGEGMQMPGAMTPPQGQTGEGQQMSDTTLPSEGETGQETQQRPQRPDQAGEPPATPTNRDPFASTPDPQSNGGILTAAVCVILLIAGILIAAFYRRRKTP